LAENNRIPEDNIVLTTVAITVSEWGRAVPYTSLGSDLGKFDPESMIQKKLKDQMSLVLDAAAAAAHKTAKIKAEATGATSINFDTNGTASQTAVSNLQVYHVEQIRDYMFSTLFIPPYENDDYVCLISTKAKRGIINDPAWEIWHKYTDPKAKWNGEIGRMENIRFIEINNTGALSGSLGSGGVCGEAIFMGEDGVAMAVAEDPELRAAIPQDYGRAKSVAWYGILEFGLVWDTANAGEAKVVHFTSA
jgi:N4-gp56 family major capsid protein